ncbi:SixA phosphatase family protein [Paraglaciecola aestuariivivens]
MKQLLGLSFALVFSCISLNSWAEPQTWYFVRHFEKQAGQDPSLTAKGKARALGLIDYFKGRQLAQVFSTDYQRTKQTATGVAESKQLELSLYNPRDLKAFAHQLSQLNQVLVVGHSNTTPQLMALMGAAQVQILESDYGDLYIVQKDVDSIRTTKVQIPVK